MNAYKFGTNALPGRRRAGKNFVPRAFVELHIRLLLRYTSAMVDIVNQLNINGDAPGQMIEC